MATNEQMLEKMDNVIIPKINANESRLNRVEPLVGNHQLVLYGDPDDRRDEGIIGAFNAMEDLLTMLKEWGSKLFWALLLGVGTFVIRQGYEMWLLYLAAK